MGKSVGKALGTVFSVVGAVAMIGTGIGAVLGGTMMFTAFGASIAASTIATMASVGALATGLLSGTPKAPSVSRNATDRLNTTFDPSAPRKIVFGRTAMATDLRYQAYTGSEQEYYHQVIAVASHQAEAIEEIWFDAERAWSATGGVVSKYSGYLTVTPQLAGSSSNTVSINSAWGAAQRLTGCAYLHLRFKLTGNSKKAESPFAQSVPSRVTVVGKGARVYDPRFDSTAGGAGGQRAADQATWAFAPSGIESGRNPALQLLFYLLGWDINGKLAVGRGFPVERIDLSSFITAANICDEPVSRSAGGSEPRYRADGIFSESDDPGLVINNLCAAMNGMLRDAGGKISLDILHNDLASPIAHFSENDIIGDEKWRPALPLDQCFNVVRGRYVDPSPSSLYQLVDYPEVPLASLDGIQRVDTFDLAAVQSASQAQRLAKTRLQRAQYQGVFSAQFNVRAWQVSIGDVVTLSHVGLGWANKLFRVIGHGIAFNGIVPMMLREEHPDIYAWDADDRPAVQAEAPDIYDPSLAPVIVEVIAQGTKLGTIEDGATNGAPAGSNVGGVPAEQVADAANQVNDPISGLPQQIIRIEEIRVDVTALQETYGDTEAAAASAAVAEQAKLDALAAAGETDADRTAVAGMATTVQQMRDETSGLVGVAQGHALVAQDKAGEASASAGQSSASAIEAAGSASAANNSKVQAQSLKDQTQSLADAAQSSSVTAGSHAAAALQSATLAAQVGGGGLIKNPVFSDWVNGGSLPQNWGEWATPFQRTKASGSFGSPNAVYEKNDSGQNSGFSQDITNIGPGKYLVEISVKLRDGPLNGAGLYLVSYSADYQSYYNAKLFSLTNALTSDGVNVGNGVALTNKLLNFSFVFDTTQNPNVSVIRLYCMTGWSEFGTANVSKWLEWHRANIKPITALEAAVMNDAGAIVEVGKRAMSFLQLETTASGLGNSATAMVSMRSEVVAGQAPTSLIALLANEIHLANGDQAGTVRKALSVAAGDTIVYGNLNVGAKLLIGSRLLAVAVQPFFVEAKDGVAVDFGTPVGDYRVDFDLSALPAPASGQSYKADALNKSPTGFLPSIKLTTQGTPSTITSTGAVTTGSAPSRRMQKANVADAANGYYTFAASGLATAFTVTYGNPGYVQIEILCYVKSPTLGWQYIGSLHTDVDGPINKGSRQAAWTVNGAVYFGGAIGLDAGGDYEFGIDFSVTGTGSVDSVNFNSVTYAAQPTTGGTTSVSQTVPARITPVNG